tara:strand:- start:368 stop:1399 length:1032 start_codon:yes stop_codon:yes gene_type:complete
MQTKITCLVFILPISIFAQIGGQTTFSFLDVILSPRIEAVGGLAISIIDDDVTLVQNTPSLLNRKMDNELAFLFTDYLSDINILGFSYAMYINNIGMLSVSLKTIDYGDFDYNNEIGENLGTFTAHDQVITIGFGKSLNENLSLGLNLNFLNSQYDIYNAFAIASNISASYLNIEKEITSTLIFRNIGRQLISYDNKKEKLPFDIQLGVSKNLKHLPFRYLLTLHNLGTFDIGSPYKLISQTNIETGELEIKQESIAKTALRHLIIGGELNPFRKSLFLRGGFNFQRRFDMNLLNYPSLVGFSWGLGFKVFKFRFDYSRASYHLSGAPNHFSITKNLSIFGVK